MNAWRKWIPLVVAVIVLCAAFAWIFQLRLGGGEVYPEYSSLRSDALGTKVFYDALGSIPGIEVDRDYRPLDKLSARPRLILLPGLIWQGWQAIPGSHLTALTTAASGGARVVLAFRADQKREVHDDADEPIFLDGKKKDEAKKDEKSGKDAEKTKKNRRRRSEEKFEPKELAKEWGVTFKQRWLMSQEEKADLAKSVTLDLPATLAWHSDLYFAPTEGSGWTTLYRRAGEPVLIEKKVGRGSIVLVADAYFLSNEAMNKDRVTSLLSWVMGDHRRITFVESSLGVLEENGVGFLARRYGLGGAMALTALLGLLYVWRRMIEFMPFAEIGSGESGELIASEPGAGFTLLLRRSLGPAVVLQSCVEEWRKAQRNGGGNQAVTARLDAAWKNHDPKKSLSSQYNALARSLKPR